MPDDYLEGDILDAIVPGGSCVTCGAPRDRFGKVDSNSPVKIEGG